MTAEEFIAFLRSLPTKEGYCVDCLGQMYNQPSSTIRGYLTEAGIQGRVAECGNCGERMETFLGRSAS